LIAPAHPAIRFLSGAVLLTAMVFVAYWPAVHAGFVWDDNILIHDNPHVIEPSGLAKIWFSTEPLDYIPLTTTMFWLEYRLFGNDPQPYHIVNLLLHAAAAVGLWRALRLLLAERDSTAGNAAFFGAVIFAVHPVCAASAAWIAEGKNTLSMALALASLAAVARSGWDRSEGFSWRWYGVSLVLFLLALLAKSAVVMMAPVLLVLVWWRQGQVQVRDVVRASPFFVLSLMMGLVTVWFQLNRAISAIDPRPEGLLSRIAAVGWCAWHYVRTLIYPVNLTLVPPRWDVPGDAVSFIPLGLLLGVLIALWVLRSRYSGGRGVVAAVACYMLMLLPVLGLVKMAWFELSLVSDHLHYFAVPAAAAVMSWGLVNAGQRLVRTRSDTIGSDVPAGAKQLVLPVVVIVVLMFGSVSASRKFESPQTLFTDVIENNPNSERAFLNRGADRSNSGNHEGAISDYLQAIRLNPRNKQSRNGMGIGLSALGRLEEAEVQLRLAVEYDPHDARVLSNLGNVLARLSRFEESLAVYDQAVELTPKEPDLHYNRATTLSRMGRRAEAAVAFGKVIELDPRHLNAYTNLGAILMLSGDRVGAEKQLRQALLIEPRAVPAMVNLSKLLLDTGRAGEALEYANRAVQMAPDSPIARTALDRASRAVAESLR
jgi:protein O-mannosyl-transferase